MSALSAISVPQFRHFISEAKPQNTIEPLIPIQDVVPSGRTPVITIALIAVNVVSLISTSAGAPAFAPFTHPALPHFIVSMLFLWLFGDNVEARLGRIRFVLVYAMGGLLPGAGAAGAVTAVLGSYFVMLPRSRVFMLAPIPPVLAEVPAIFLLLVWATWQVVQHVRHPHVIWMFAAAFVIGAVVGRLGGGRVQWR